MHRDYFVGIFTLYPSESSRTNCKNKYTNDALPNKYRKCCPLKLLISERLPILSTLQYLMALSFRNSKNILLGRYPHICKIPVQTESVQLVGYSKGDNTDAQNLIHKQKITRITRGIRFGWVTSRLRQNTQDVQTPFHPSKREMTKIAKTFRYGWIPSRVRLQILKI